jgi:23S rRNA (uracil1939-C5)-methyltransferase
VQKGEEVTLTIDNLSGDGTTVARVDGMVFFVEKAVPGDTVKARVWKVKKNFVEARAIEIITPSVHRVEPKCKHFGVCGGCKWQDYAYEAQLISKQQLVANAFKRIGNFENPDVKPVIGCDTPYYYRNKMEFTFSNYRWLSDEEMKAEEEVQPGVALGLHVPQRWDKVVDLEECWLQSELSSAILNTVREVAKGWNLTVYSSDTQTGYLRHLVVRESKRTEEVMVNLVTSTHWPEGMEKLTALLLKHFPQITTIVNNVTARRSMVAFGEQERVYHGPGFITDKLGDYTFRISANSFFQTNTLQAEKLYDVAKRFAALHPTDIVYDLYSGTGTIAIYVSDAVERVIGIEVVESAIADAERNVETNHVSNCYFLQGDLKDRLIKDSSWLTDHPKPTVIIVDPPRSGMHAKVIEQIIKLSPQRVVYVSCNPSTQARDAALLVKGGYILEMIQPVDMFPHTDHIEAVALFNRA